MSSSTQWERFKKYYCSCPEIGLSLDISRMDFPDAFLSAMEPAMQRAFAAMAELERGAIANPDEGRMVGHYWLRAPELAPATEIAAEIRFTLQAIKEFAETVHHGEIAPQSGGRFTRLLVVGIGGSALGPQFVADALGNPGDRMQPYFFDNTDPDGMDRVIATLGRHLAETLTVVISKSGGTKETRNGMQEAKAAYEAKGLAFARHAVAVTGKGSELDKTAEAERWLARFPMWDWVGGRTSETSAVGLLPAALQGLDIEALLSGARDCDDRTRTSGTATNPAALLALMWYYATDGRGAKDMVVLPYKDRLLLFSRYLQQLIMESLGKERNLAGNVVHQGISVYGNKGSTDQHAYVQQLREGVPNFFVTFIEVLRDRDGTSLQVENDVTSGDYLSGFYLGTRQALHENGRESLTLTVDSLDARTVGVLIALYERAVGLYASLVGINAYHQPGVEAGKKTASAVLDTQKRILTCLRRADGRELSLDEIAIQSESADDPETVFKVLEHLRANPDHGISATEGETPFHRRYRSVR